jgi:hypothetical protein
MIKSILVLLRLEPCALRRFVKEYYADRLYLKEKIYDR